MTNYQSYDTYVEVDVKWVGEAPAGWQVQPFFVYASQCKRSNKGMVNDNLLSLSFGRVVRKDIETSEGLLPESFETYQIIEPDDVVFRFTDLQNDRRSLRSALCNERGIITAAYLAARPCGIEPRYFAYLMRSYDLMKVFYALGSGLRQSLKYSDVKRLPLLVPALAEQNQIAKFLDYETTKIDALIEKQQQLIALLQEKRRAVISHAVTRGLNPDVPMRDSGVEWLGVVPAHWTACRVKQVISFITSGPRGWSDLISEEGSEVFLQSGDLNDRLGLRLETAKRITPPSNAEGVRTKMQNGDVVVCITGAKTGRVAVAVRLPETVFVNQHLSLVRPVPERVHSEFLAASLTSFPVRSYFAGKQYGLKEGLSLTNVAEAPLCLPPMNEQQAIMAHLAAIEDKMDRLNEVAAGQIAVLQERRAAFISAAVTGKIDVRGWKPPESATEEDAP